MKKKNRQDKNEIRNPSGENVNHLSEFPDLPELQRSSRQSVRTTIRMPLESFDRAADVAKRSGITLNEVFDEMAKMLEALQEENPEFLDRILQLAESAKSREGVRRAQIMSRGALKKFTALARKRRISRDALLQIVIDLASVCAEQERQSLLTMLKEADRLADELRIKCEEYDGFMSSIAERCPLDFNEVGGVLDYNSDGIENLRIDLESEGTVSQDDDEEG